jgi:rhodanese-related sulfurtransferase
LFVLTGCDRTVDDRDIKFATIAEVRSLVGEGDRAAVLLIDSRSKAAHEAGHLPGAVNVPLYDLQRDEGLAKKWKQFGEIIVYGEDPASGTARAVTKRLLEIGYSDVRMFAGGLAEWTKGGFPLETGAK